MYFCATNKIIYYYKKVSELKILIKNNYDSLIIIAIQV